MIIVHTKSATNVVNRFIERPFQIKVNGYTDRINALLRHKLNSDFYVLMNRNGPFVTYFMFEYHHTNMAVRPPSRLIHNTPSSSLQYDCTPDSCDLLLVVEGD